MHIWYDLQGSSTSPDVKVRVDAYHHVVTSVSLPENLKVFVYT